MVNCWSEARRHEGLPRSSPSGQGHCLDYLAAYMATILLGDLTSDGHRLFFPGQSGQVIPLSPCKPETMSLCPDRPGGLLQPIAALVNNGHAAAPAHQASECCPTMHFWGHVPASCSGSGPDQKWNGDGACARGCNPELDCRPANHWMKGTVIGQDSSVLASWVHHGFLGCQHLRLLRNSPSIWAPYAFGRWGWKKTPCSLQCSAPRILPKYKSVSRLQPARHFETTVLTP